MSYNIDLYTVIGRERALALHTMMQEAIQKAVPNVRWDFWQNSISHRGIRSMRTRWSVNSKTSMKSPKELGMGFDEYLRYLDATYNAETKDAYAEIQRIVVNLHPPEISATIRMIQGSFVYNTLYQSGTFHRPTWRPRIGEIVNAFGIDESTRSGSMDKPIQGKIVQFVRSEFYWNGAEQSEGVDQHYIIECMENHPSGYSVGDLLESDHVFRIKA